MEQLQKKALINQLQRDILLWQGFKAPASDNTGIPGLGAVEAAFPNATFPQGAIHEFINAEPENSAACGGFLAALLHILMENGGVCLWISKTRKLFPPALKVFGVSPDRIIFIDLEREKDILWVREVALYCVGLVAVIGEVREISFAQSRRLQLAVESSRVTGFILRTDAQKLSSTACVARWKISPIPSAAEDGLPGLGFPRWNVELLKVRNGNPGVWKMEWAAGEFKLVNESINEHVAEELRRKTG